MPKEKFMYKVLLISLVNWDSLIEIPAILKTGGCAVDIFSIKDSWVLQNQFHDKWIPGNMDQNIFVNELLEFIDKNGDDYNWIIPGDDVIIRLLNEHIKSESLFYRILPITKIENRELLGSKAGFSSLCTKYEITTPRYLIYNESMQPEDIGSYMGYPFLMKLDKSEGGFGVFMCENKSELLANLGNAKNKENLVFQQFIKGYDVNIEVLYRHGELLVYSYSRTLTVMGRFGVSTQRLFYQNTEIEPELIKMGKSLGLSGFGNVVFMYDENGKTHYLIEIDMRPNAWMYYGKFMGNNFSEGIRRITKNELRLVVPETKDSNKQLMISLYKKDIYRCLIEKDVSGMLKWFTNADGRWRYIPLYDSKLFRACTRYLFKSFWELALNKIRKK